MSLSPPIVPSGGTRCIHDGRPRGQNEPDEGPSHAVLRVTAARRGGFGLAPLRPRFWPMRTCVLRRQRVAWKTFSVFPLGAGLLVLALPASHDWFAGRGPRRPIPKAHPAIEAARRQGPSIGCKGKRLDPGVDQTGSPKLKGREMPGINHAMEITCGQRATVRADRHGQDITFWSIQYCANMARGYVPKLKDRASLVAQNQDLAVARECDGNRHALRTGDRETRLASRHVPEPYRPVPAKRNQ